MADAAGRSGPAPVPRAPPAGQGGRFATVDFVAGEALGHRRSDITLTVVVPEVGPKHRWQRLPHHRTASRLRRTLIRCPGIIISVRFQLT